MGLSDTLLIWSRKYIAIDLETKDPDLKGGSGAIQGDIIVGIAVAVEGWKGYYPIAHEGGGNIDRRTVEWFRKVSQLILYKNIS